MDTLTLADINFECSTCGQRLVVDAVAAGSTIACPMCAVETCVPPAPAYEHAIYGGERATARDFLTPLHRSIGESSHTPERLQRELEVAYAEIKALRQERDRGAASHAQVEIELKQLHGEVAALLAEQEKQRATSHAEALAWHAALEHAQQEHRAAAETHAQEEAALHERLEISRQRATALEAQLAAREQELAEKVSYLESMRRDCSELEESLALQQAQVEALGPQAEAAREYASRLEVTVERLHAMERSGHELTGQCQSLQAEIEVLKLGLNESESGRELMAVRDRLRQLEDDRQTAARFQRLAEEESEKLRLAGERLQEDLTALRQRCQEAERHMETEAASRAEDDRAILRGIVERQVSELAQQHSELRKLRTAQLGLRLAYAVVSICTLGVVAVGVRLAQHAF